MLTKEQFPWRGWGADGDAEEQEEGRYFKGGGILKGQLPWGKDEEDIVEGEHTGILGRMEKNPTNKWGPQVSVLGGGEGMRMPKGGDELSCPSMGYEGGETPPPCRV